MIYQKVSISKQKWGNLRSAAVLVYAFPSPSEHFFFVFWHMKVSVEEHCCQQQREYQEINLWSKNTGFADIHPLPELNHHYVLPVLKQDMCVRVWERVCVCVLIQETHITVLTKGTESFLQVPYSLVIFTETKVGWSISSSPLKTKIYIRKAIHVLFKETFEIKIYSI